MLLSLIASLLFTIFLLPTLLFRALLYVLISGSNHYKAVMMRPCDIGNKSFEPGLLEPKPRICYLWCMRRWTSYNLLLIPKMGPSLSCRAVVKAPTRSTRLIMANTLKSGRSGNVSSSKIHVHEAFLDLNQIKPFPFLNPIHYNLGNYFFIF